VTNASMTTDHDGQRSQRALRQRTQARCLGKPVSGGSIRHPIYALRPMRRPLAVALLIVASLHSGPSAGQESSPASSIGRYSGLPLPRFASVRSEPVNLRRGPGLRYPIKWVLHRPGLPVEIVQEFYAWRAVRLSDGTDGWIHQSLLSGRRSFIVRGAALLRAEAKSGADAIARLERGVIGHILNCGNDSDWCKVEVDGYRGYLRRSNVWGIFKTKERPAEKIQPICAAIAFLGLFSVTACQQPNPASSVAEAQATGTMTPVATGATSTLAAVPPCPDDLRATLKSGLIVQFKGSIANDPSVCIQEWRGRMHQYCLGFWDVARLRLNAGDQCMKLREIMQAPVGTTVTLDLHGGRSWKFAVLTREANDSLLIGPRKRSTVKLRVVRQDTAGRAGTTAETLYWIDRATGAPLKKQIVIRMADGDVQRATIWDVASLGSASVAAAALPDTVRAVTE
jgi:SH3-like domain-containing protein